jgi:uncharacterized protein involved in exopolysaccharide biosynthesis
MNESVSVYEDEIDLREIVVTLLANWKTIVLLMFLAAATAFGISFVQKPVYQASAVTVIDTSAVAGIDVAVITTNVGAVIGLNPLTWLAGDEIRQRAASSLGISQVALPEPVVRQDILDKTKFTITAQADTAVNAAQFANAWADAAIAFFRDKVNAALFSDEAQRAFEDADAAFVDFLKEHNLDSLSWAELAYLTGVGKAPAIAAPPESLPSLSRQQRLALASLMQARAAAEETWFTYSDRVADARYALALNPPAVVARATPPVAPIRPKPLQNTLLGAALGGILGVFWVFAARWWRKLEAA